MAFADLFLHFQFFFLASCVFHTCEMHSDVGVVAKIPKQKQKQKQQKAEAEAETKGLNHPPTSPRHI